MTHYGTGRRIMERAGRSTLGHPATILSLTVVQRILSHNSERIAAELLIIRAIVASPLHSVSR